MPTYAYACTACGHAFDAMQKFSDDPLTVCPECAGRLRKVYTSIGVTFKGSGFYRTDSRAASNGKASNGSVPAEKRSPDKASADKNGSSGGSDTSAGSAGSSASASSSSSRTAAAS